MPTPTRTACGIRLRPDALDRFAAAIGDEAWRGGKNGRPNYAILTGTNRDGQGSRLVRGESFTPETLATVGQRYAEAAGIDDFWAAVAEVFEPVDAQGVPLAPHRPARARRGSVVKVAA